MNSYSIKHQDGEYIVCNKKGVIVSYCATKAQAEDVKQAQQRDEERQSVEAAYNAQQLSRALRAEFTNEFI